MTMNLEEWQKNWDQLGKDDPLWVVLTHPAKKGGKWKPDEFFETGTGEIREVLDSVRSLGVELKCGKALDFGCGVGRLSRALSEQFTEVHGVDISPSMITYATAFNRDRPNCHFHLSASDRLETFQDGWFDFVYSNIALQHIEPKYSKQYIREFFRVLRPGGIAVFQLITSTWLRRLFPLWFVERYRQVRYRGRAFIGMFGVPERVVTSAVQDAGGKVLSIQRQLTGWRWVSLRYCAVKSDA